MAQANRVANWLEITKSQRSRQAVTMLKQFGPNSAATKEIAAEITDIEHTIAQLRNSPDTPLEQFINSKTK